MKEAAGELNMTAITVVAVGLIAGLFIAFVLPTLSKNIRLNQDCAAAVCGDCTGTTMSCTLMEDNGTRTFDCPCKE